jgi:hypothetical protein
MKFTNTKFAIAIFLVLAYVATLIQAEEFHDPIGYVHEFQANHAKIVGNLKDTIHELEHRMVVFKKRMQKYHNQKARL